MKKCSLTYHWKKICSFTTLKNSLADNISIYGEFHERLKFEKYFVPTTTLVTTFYTVKKSQLMNFISLQEAYMYVRMCTFTHTCLEGTFSGWEISCFYSKV